MPFENIKKNPLAAGFLREHVTKSEGQVDAVIGYLLSKRTSPDVSNLARELGKHAGDDSDQQVKNLQHYVVSKAENLFKEIKQAIRKRKRALQSSVLSSIPAAAASSSASQQPTMPQVPPYGLASVCLNGPITIGEFEEMVLKIMRHYYWAAISGNPREDGILMHTLTFNQLQTYRDILRISGDMVIKVEPRYKWTSIAEKAAYYTGSDMRGTVTPDIVVHARGDPNDVKYVFELKFPALKNYARPGKPSHRLSEGDQICMYADALEPSKGVILLCAKNGISTAMRHSPRQEAAIRSLTARHNARRRMVDFNALALVFTSSEIRAEVASTVLASASSASSHIGTSIQGATSNSPSEEPTQKKQKV